jgi:hypothetical protein
VRFSDSMLEVMHRGRRVALHAVASETGEVSTVPEHRPIAHIRVLEGEPKALMRWAESIGPGATEMFKHHLEARPDAANGVRAARRMRELARLYGDARFEEASAYALKINTTALRSVESILKLSPDKMDKACKTTPRPAHSNVRGATYFGEAL